MNNEKLSPFDFINSINEGSNSKDLFTSVRNSKDGLQINALENQYIPFIINRGLSFSGDTVLYANEMNRLNRLSQIMQYDFLKNIIRPRKRYLKWVKMEEEEEINVIMKAYKYSYHKARSVFPILKDQINTLRKYIDQGGIKK